MGTSKRKLAVIVFADIANYSAIMHENEADAVIKLKAFESTINKYIKVYEGKIIQFYGDGCLMVFDDAASSIRFSQKIQNQFSSQISVPVRIGIHLGDIVFDQKNIYGDNVNIASRIESMGIPGSILMSHTVSKQVKNLNEFDFVSLGSHNFKNIEEPIEVFAISGNNLPIPDPKNLQGKFSSKGPNKSSSLPKVLIAGMAILILGLGWIFKDKLFPLTEASSQTKLSSLAIFPFTNILENDPLRALGDGVAENLIYRISKISNKKIISKHSTFALRDSVTNNLIDVSKVINADAYLVGEFTQSEGLIKVNAELISNDLDHLQQIKDEKPVSQMHLLEDDILKKILMELDGTANDEKIKSTRPVNPEAYRLYTQGKQMSFITHQDSTKKVLELFKKAVELEPGYAPFYASIANHYFDQARFSNTTRDQLLGEANKAINSAFEKDPTLAEAYLAKANIHFYCDFDWNAADESYKKALEHDSQNATIFSDYSFFKCAMNEYDEAAQLAIKALEFDPASISSLHIMGWSLLYTNPKLAAEYFRKATIFHPDWMWGHMKEGMAYLLSGPEEHKKCLQKMRDVERMKGKWGSELLEVYLAVMYTKLNLHEDAERQFQKITAHEKEFGVTYPLNLAILYGNFGKFEEMKKYLNQCYNIKSPNLAVLKLPYDLDLFSNNIFANSDFQELLTKMNLNTK